MRAPSSAAVAAAATPLVASATKAYWLAPLNNSRRARTSARRDSPAATDTAPNERAYSTGGDSDAERVSQDLPAQWNGERVGHRAEVMGNTREAFARITLRNAREPRYTETGGCGNHGAVGFEDPRSWVAPQHRVIDYVDHHGLAWPRDRGREIRVHSAVALSRTGAKWSATDVDLDDVETLDDLIDELDDFDDMRQWRQ